MKYCSRSEPSLENCGSPTLRFGELLDFSLSFCPRHSAAWPAAFQITIKNNAESSFFKPFCNMSGQCFHIFISPSFSALSLFRIREILWCHLRCIDRSLFWRSVFQSLNVSARGRHCLIDEARARHSVSFLFWSNVCRSVQSPRYQAAYAFLRLWRWSLLPLLQDSFCHRRSAAKIVSRSGLVSSIIIWSNLFLA